MFYTKTSRDVGMVQYVSITHDCSCMNNLTGIKSSETRRVASYCSMQPHGGQHSLVPRQFGYFAPFLHLAMFSYIDHCHWQLHPTPASYRLDGYIVFAILPCVDRSKLVVHRLYIIYYILILLASYPFVH